MLIKNFERIQLLSLDKRKDNWLHIQNEFVKRGGKIEKFIVGKGDIFPRHIYNHVDTNQVLPTWHPMFTNNASHCYVSHRKILEKARSDKINNILMLEDDLVLTEDFDQIIEKVDVQLRKIKTWDMLYYGAINKWAVTEQVSENLIKIKFGGYNWHCTAINNKDRDNFSDLLNLPPIGPFDVITAFFYQPVHEVYSIWPPIVLQKPGHSFVCERYLDNLHLFKYKGMKDMDFKKEWYIDKRGKQN